MFVLRRWGNAGARLGSRVFATCRPTVGFGEVRFEPVEVSGPAIDHCLEALRQTRTHGGVRLGSFHAPEHKVFDGFASRNFLVDVDGGDELGFARHSFSSSAVRSLFSEAQTAELPEDFMLDFPPVFGYSSPFTSKRDRRAHFRRRGLQIVSGTTRQGDSYGMEVA